MSLVGMGRPLNWGTGEGLMVMAGLGQDSAQRLACSSEVHLSQRHQADPKGPETGTTAESAVQTG